MMESSQGICPSFHVFCICCTMSTDGIYTIVYVHILPSLPLLCAVMYALFTVDITHKACYSANSADMKGILCFVCSGLPSSSSPVTRGESTQTMSTMDERSEKIKEIVDKYRSGEGKLFLPRNPDLEDELDDVLGNLRVNLSSADSRVISKLQAIVQMKYRRYIHGVRPVPLPPVPNTVNGLYEFIAEKSTPYEILLVHHAVEVLEDEDLKKDLQEYESKLAEHLKEMLMSCKRRRVPLPLFKNHTHMAIVISKEQVLLSLVLEMKEYFSKYLQLEETLFEGFEEGCTVLFFSILRVDAALLSPKVLSHLSELERMFGMTHLIVFGYFACDLEKATIELVVSVCILHVLCTRDVPGLEWTRPKPPF